MLKQDTTMTMHLDGSILPIRESFVVFVSTTNQTKIRTLFLWGNLDFEIVGEDGGVDEEDMGDCVESFLDFIDVCRDGEDVFVDLGRSCFEIFADCFLLCDVLFQVL
jgi:hypothetical protein